MNAASASDRVFGVKAPMSVGVIDTGRAIVVWLSMWFEPCSCMRSDKRETAASFASGR